MPRHREKPQRTNEGVRLKGLRETLGLTQRELATEFNVTAGAIAQWENGERTVAGPILKLVQLYERELEAPHDRVASRWSPPTGWLRRNGSVAVASAFWLGLRPLLGADASSVAGRTRMALARNYVRLVGDLKGLAMKLGQLVSYMDFGMPEPEAALLGSLQTTSRAMPASEVGRVVREELGKLPGQLFEEWVPEPISSASIGQVHRAALGSGEPVAVKVQYPKMVEALKADLGHIRRLDRAVCLLWRGQQAGVIYAEMGARFIEECNYIQEARWQERFRELFAGHPTIVVPEVIKRLSARRVLTTRFFAGAPFAAFAAAASVAERERAATALLEFHWTSLLRRGWFHTDPHPGNVLFGEDGRMGFVDFGRVQELSSRFLGQWRRAIRATLERDRDGVSKVCLEMGTIPAPDTFNHAYGYRYMATFYRPFLTERFRFTPAYLRQLWRVWVTDNVNALNTSYPADMAFFNQLTFGLGSVLCRLDVEVGCRALLLDLLYEPGERRPAPFSQEELAALEL